MSITAMALPTPCAAGAVVVESETTAAAMTVEILMAVHRIKPYAKNLAPAYFAAASYFGRTRYAVDGANQLLIVAKDSADAFVKLENLFTTSA